MQKNFFFFTFSLLINHVGAQMNANLNWLITSSSYYNGGNVNVQDIATDRDSSIVAVGYFERNADFDPGPDTFNLKSLNNQDIFIAKYSKEGKLIFAYSFGEVEDSPGNISQSNDMDDIAYSVVLDNAGNAYMTGVFAKTIDFNPGPEKKLLSTRGSREIFVASFSAQGNFKFAFNIGSANSNNQTSIGKSIALDMAGNIYVGGTFSGKNIDFDPTSGNALLSSSGNIDMFFAKYDSTGKYLMAKSIGGSSSDECRTLLLDPNNNIILYGIFSSQPADFDPGTGTAYIASNGESDIFIAKYDSSGKYLFAKGIGGTRSEVGGSIAVSKDKGLVFTGSFNSIADFDAGPDDHTLFATYRNRQIFICKYDKDGNYNFAFDLGGAENDEAEDIAIDNNDQICVTGIVVGDKIDFNPGPDSFYLSGKDYMSQIYLAKYTATGDFITVYGLGGNNGFPNLSLSAGMDGSLFLAGNFADSVDADPSMEKFEMYAANNATAMFIFSYNKRGKLYSSVHTGSYENYSNDNNRLMTSCIDSAGNIYAAGTFSGRFDFDPGPGTLILESLTGYSTSAWFAKYKPDGTLLFAKAIIGYLTFINDIAIDKDQNIYFIGTATGQTDFDPSIDKKYLNNSDTPVANIIGYFFAKYDQYGNLIFANGENGGNNLKANAIAVDSNKNIYLSGGFGQNIDFDPGPGKHILKNLGVIDIFIAKYDRKGKFIFAKMIGAQKNASYTNDIKISNLGDFLLCGSIQCDSLDFDITSKQKFVKGLGFGFGGSGAFSVSYKQNGNLNFAFSVLGQKEYADVTVKSLSIDKQGNFFTGGTSWGAVDFDPDSSVFTLNKTGTYIYFAAYNYQGKFRFVKSIDTNPISNSQYNEISDICLDRDNNIYIAGQYGSIGIDCDPSLDTSIIYNKYYDLYRGNTNLFIAKYDSIGQYLYSLNLRGDSAIGYNYGASLNVDKDNNIIFTGNAVTKIDFDPDTKNVFLQPTTIYDNPFIVKYSQAFIFPKRLKTIYAVKR